MEAGTKLRLPADAMLGTSQTSSAYACHGACQRHCQHRDRHSASISPHTGFRKELLIPAEHTVRSAGPVSMAVNILRLGSTCDVHSNAHALPVRSLAPSLISVSRRSCSVFLLHARDGRNCMHACPEGAAQVTAACERPSCVLRRLQATGRDFSRCACTPLSAAHRRSATRVRLRRSTRARSSCQLQYNSVLTYYLQQLRARCSSIYRWST